MIRYFLYHLIFRLVWKLFSAIFSRRHHEIDVDRISGQASHVIDGDTLMIGRHKIRIAGIDTPEMGQPMIGSVAKNILSDLVMGRHLEVIVTDRDRYGRYVGNVFVGDTDIGLEILRRGYAVAAYNPPNEYQRAEKSARRARAGLWSLGNFQNPSEFRAAHW